MPGCSVPALKLLKNEISSSLRGKRLRARKQQQLWCSNTSSTGGEKGKGGDLSSFWKHQNEG